MRQAEAVVARAPVVSWDVDALMDAASIVLGYTFVYICREKAQQNMRAGSRQRNTFIFFLGRKKNQYQSQAKLRSQVIGLTLKQNYGKSTLLKIIRLSTYEYSFYFYS